MENIRGYKGIGWGQVFTTIFMFEGTQYKINTDTLEEIQTIFNDISKKDGIPEGLEMVTYTKDELKVKNWLESYEALSVTDKWLIKTAIPELETHPILKRKDVETIKRIAYSRIMKAGFKTECSRCNGTGEHSFNQRDGKLCFKCRGQKFQMIKLTKESKLEIKNHFAK